MDKNFCVSNVSERYLNLRKQVLKYSNEDMNLSLENDNQVYIAVFDIPLKSNIIGFQTQTLALVFGLNTHVYHGSGNVMVELEKNPEVMQAMQSLLISCHQVLNNMKITTDTEYYDSEYVRAYLKTRKGTYVKELRGESKDEKFLLMLMNHVLEAIAKSKA